MKEIRIRNIHVFHVLLKRIFSFSLFFFYLEEIGLIQEGNRKSYLERDILLSLFVVIILYS